MCDFVGRKTELLISHPDASNYVPIQTVRQIFSLPWASTGRQRYHAGVIQRKTKLGRPVKVAPSLLSADFAHLAEALSTIDTSPADQVHLDIMDGNFVDEISFGAKLVEDLRVRSELPFDVHLMVREPARHAVRFARAGADVITVHLEACQEAGCDVPKLMQSIKYAGARAGIAISPQTPAAALEQLLDSIDLALVMTVTPGAGGQPLIPSCLAKARELVSRRQRGGHAFEISVDGGLHRGNACNAAAIGVDVVVIGSAIWRAPVPADEIRAINVALASIEAPKTRSS